MKILNDAPLYKFDPTTGNVERIENEYSDKKVIRYTDSEGQRYDVPIEKKITICHLEGDIFFESMSLAEKFRHSLANIRNGSAQTLLENFLEASKRSEVILEFSQIGEPVENGIYSIQGMDEDLKADSWLHNIIYLDDKRNIRTIKRPDKNLDKYLVKYITMHNLEKYDSYYERLLFEVYSEGGMIYINHFVIQDAEEPYDLFYTTRANHYFLFPNLITANRFRRIEKAGALTAHQLESHITSECILTEAIQEHDERIEKVKNVAQILVQFGIEHYTSVLGHVMRFFKKNHNGGNVETSPTPDIEIPESIGENNVA